MLIMESFIKWGLLSIAIALIFSTSFNGDAGKASIIKVITATPWESAHIRLHGTSAKNDFTTLHVRFSQDGTFTRTGGHAAQAGTWALKGEFGKSFSLTLTETNGFQETYRLVSIDKGKQLLELEKENSPSGNLNIIYTFKARARF